MRGWQIQGVQLVAQDSAEFRAAGRALLARVVDSYSAASEDRADRLQALTALENLADALARDGEVTAAADPRSILLLRSVGPA